MAILKTVVSDDQKKEAIANVIFAKTSIMGVDKDSVKKELADAGITTKEFNDAVKKLKDDGKIVEE